MEQWHYDPWLDLDESLIARLNEVLRTPGNLVDGLRCLAATVVRSWLRVYHRFTIVGQTNLPLHRSFILVANHASHLDTLCLLAALPIGRLQRTFPIAARDYFCVSPWRGLLAKVVANALPFERCFAPWRSLSLCAQLLDRPGTILILFPEGTRGGGPCPTEFKPGVALLAAGHEIPLVPCHLAGTHAALPKGSWCPRRLPLRLTIGAPRMYAHLPATRESAAQICRELREAVILLGRAKAKSQHERPVGRADVVDTSLSPVARVP